MPAELRLFQLRIGKEWASLHWTVYHRQSVLKLRVIHTNDCPCHLEKVKPLEGVRV